MTEKQPRVVTERTICRSGEQLEWLMGQGWHVVSYSKLEPEWVLERPNLVYHEGELKAAIAKAEGSDP